MVVKIEQLSITFRCGFVHRDTSVGSGMINARSETAAVKPAFREAPFGWTLLPLVRSRSASLLRYANPFPVAIPVRRTEAFSAKILSPNRRNRLNGLNPATVGHCSIPVHQKQQQNCPGHCQMSNRKQPPDRLGILFR